MVSRTTWIFVTLTNLISALGAYNLGLHELAAVGSFCAGAGAMRILWHREIVAYHVDPAAPSEFKPRTEHV